MAGPWWAPGGMAVFCNGYPLLLVVLVANSVSLAAELPVAAQLLAVASMFIGMILARRSSAKVYFWLTVPMFSVGIALGVVLPNAAAWYAWFFLLMQLKIGVCMSCCLHRYAAHAAFKCGPYTSLAMGGLGCLANQGGPIWWASKHRAHHKLCDTARDPHSVLHMGEIEAFAFFTKQQRVDEEYAPVHIDSLGMRVIDTFAIAFPLAECLIAWLLLGRGGVWASLASAFFAQTETLYFNLANHPPHPAGKGEDHACLATDACEYVPSNVFLKLLNSITFMGEYLGEGSHAHHHGHANLARRPGLDWPYHIFIRPLAALQLVWHVRTGTGRDD